MELFCCFLKQCFYAEMRNIWNNQVNYGCLPEKDLVYTDGMSFQSSADLPFVLNEKAKLLKISSVNHEVRNPLEKKLLKCVSRFVCTCSTTNSPWNITTVFLIYVGYLTAWLTIP